MSEALRPHLRQPALMRDLVETLVFVALMYTLVNLATVRFFVDGPSMQPTFYTGQYLIVSRVHYLFAAPQRGEVAVFSPPDTSPDDPPLIKRVIGLPGEMVELRSGQVFINGTALPEPYVLGEACAAARCQDRHWVLGADEYFLMGDNRNNSRDSRAFGPVALDRFIGEAVVRYWPPADWGMMVGRHEF